MLLRWMYELLGETRHPVPTPSSHNYLYNITRIGLVAVPISPRQRSTSDNLILHLAMGANSADWWSIIFLGVHWQLHWFNRH
jgi:hypothetical protein